MIEAMKEAARITKAQCWHIPESRQPCSLCRQWEKPIDEALTAAHAAGVAEGMERAAKVLRRYVCLHPQDAEEIIRAIREAKP